MSDFPQQPARASGEGTTLEAVIARYQRGAYEEAAALFASFRESAPEAPTPMRLHGVIVESAPNPTLSRECWKIRGFNYMAGKPSFAGQPGKCPQTSPCVEFTDKMIARRRGGLP